MEWHVNLLHSEKVCVNGALREPGHNTTSFMPYFAISDTTCKTFVFDEYIILNLLWFLSSDNIKPSEKEKTKTKVKETKVNSKKQTKKEPETEKENPIIRNEKKEDNKEIFAYTRDLGSEQLLVICNFTGKDTMFKYEESAEIKCKELLISNYDADVNEPISNIELKPYECRYYKFF